MSPLPVVVVFSIYLLQSQTISSQLLGLSSSSGACAKLSFVSRSQWRANEANSDDLRLFEAKPEHVFVHQTSHQPLGAPNKNSSHSSPFCFNYLSCSAKVRSLQRQHQLEKSLPDLSYHLLIASDGSVYEGAGVDFRGYHTWNYNNDSLGIALIGSYEAPDDEDNSRHQPTSSTPINYFTEQMELTLRWLLECLVDSDKLSVDYELHGHRDATCATSCPGDTVYKRLGNFEHFRPGPLARYSCADSWIGRRPNSRMRRSGGPLGVEQQPAGITSGQSDDYFVGLIRRRRQQQHHSSPASHNNNLVLMQTAAVGALKDKPIILVNMANQVQVAEPAGQHQQPTLYLLQSTKTIRTSPATLLITPLISSTSSSGTSGSSSGRQPSSEGGSSSGSSGSSRPSGGSGGSSQDSSGGSSRGGESGGSQSRGQSGSQSGGQSGGQATRQPSRSSGGQEQQQQQQQEDSEATLGAGMSASLATSEAGRPSFLAKLMQFIHEESLM